MLGVKMPGEKLENDWEKWEESVQANFDPKNNKTILSNDDLRMLE